MLRRLLNIIGNRHRHGDMETSKPLTVNNKCLTCIIICLNYSRPNLRGLSRCYRRRRLRLKRARLQPLNCSFCNPTAQSAKCMQCSLICKCIHVYVRQGEHPALSYPGQEGVWCRIREQGGSGVALSQDDDKPAVSAGTAVAT